MGEVLSQAEQMFSLPSALRARKHRTHGIKGGFDIDVTVLIENIANVFYNSFGRDAGIATERRFNRARFVSRAAATAETS